ncbi:MAG: hypothetical protein OXE46_12145 [Chloroflexi bacterium]|nr:hypothetical protein [Chloroflexota bacterium]
MYAIIARDLEKLSEDDPVLLDYAIENGLVVCSHDADNLELARRLWRLQPGMMPTT